MLGCNETFTRAGSADMYFVSRAKSFRVVQAGTTAALNFRFTRHKASKYRHMAKATPLMDAVSLKIKLLMIKRVVFSALFTSTSYHVKILTFNAIF